MENLKDLWQMAIDTPSPANKVVFQKAFYDATYKVVFLVAAAWFGKIEAQDMVQQIYTRIFSRPLQRLAKAVMPDAILAFMTKTAVNYCREEWRRRKIAQQRIEGYFQNRRNGLSGDPGDQQIAMDYLRAHLSEKEAQVISLQFNHDLEDCEIREHMALSSNDAVRKLRSRALRKLRRRYGASP
jgi:DNA-directed RNA polymerase specialized sigma24 family protein